jgi:hypothetical protein
MQVGFNTIRFRVPEVELDPAELLKRGWQTRGEEVRARKWYWTWVEPKIQVRYNPPDLLIKASLPRLLYGVVTRIVPLRDVNTALDELNRTLSEALGCELDIANTALPTRTDFAYVWEVPDPPAFLHAAWRAVDVPRTRRIRYPSGLTLLWFNKVRSLRLSDRSRDVSPDAPRKPLRLEVSVRGRERLARYMIPLSQMHREFVIRSSKDDLLLRDLARAHSSVGRDTMEHLTRYQLVGPEEFEDRLKALCEQHGLQFKKMRDRLTEVAEQGWESLEARLPAPTYRRFRRQAEAVGILPGETNFDFRFVKEELEAAIWGG